MQPLISSLSRRELEVSSLAVMGLSNVAIAAELNISHRTVERYLLTTYYKLYINNRKELTDFFEVNGRPTVRLDKRSRKSAFESDIIRIASSEKTIKEVAKQAGCSYMTAYRIMKKHNFFISQKPKQLFSYQGRNYSIKGLAAIAKIPSECIYQRINCLGWSVEKALTTPRQQKGHAVAPPKNVILAPPVRVATLTLKY